MECMGTTICLIIGGVACYAGWRYLTQGTQRSTSQAKRISSPRATTKGLGAREALSTPQNYSQEPRNEAGEKWFDSIVDDYSKKTLAFFVSKYAWDNKLSAEKIINLQGQYGRVTLQPTIVEFESGFKEQGLSLTHLTNLGIKWLKNRGIESDGASWEKILEKHISEQKSAEAEKIIERFMA